MTERPWAYFGGKGNRRLLDWLLPILPHTESYVEACAGGGAVYFAKRPRSAHNILNDVDDRMYVLYKVVKHRPQELLDQLELTIPHISDFLACDFRTTDEIELARQTVMQLCLNRHQLPLDPVDYKFSVLWGTHGGNGSDKLERFIRRCKTTAKALRPARILNMDVCALLDKVNGKQWNTLIYIDPPYVPDSRLAPAMYRCEMSVAQHEAMLERCVDSPHKIAISGYDNDLYSDTLAGWHRHECEYWTVTSGERKTARTEVLWTNYAPPAATQLALKEGG